MSLGSQFETNQENEVNGVPVPFAPNKDGSIPTFMVSRMSKSNKRYQKALAAAIRPHQRAQQLGTLPAETQEAIFLEVFVGHVLRGWDNVLLSDVTGNKADTGFAPYTKENATALFRRLPDLYDSLTDAANSAALFREGVLEEEAGN